MASGDVFKITLMMTFGAVECRPGFHLIEGGGGAGLGPTRDAADHVAMTLAGSPLAGFSENLHLHHIRAEDVQPGLAASYETDTGVLTGDIPDDNPVPPQDSMVVTWTTDVKRIAGVFAAGGRIYIPGIYSTGQISGFLIPELQTALGAFAQLLYDAYIADGTAYQLHVVSYNPGSNPRTIRAVNPITNYIVRNQVRSQRRRQVGVGI